MVVAPTGIESASFDKLRMTRVPAAPVEYPTRLSGTGFRVLESRLVPSNPDEFRGIRLDGR
jgi:hypothetical protein